MGPTWTNPGGPARGAHSPPWSLSITSPIAGPYPDVSTLLCHRVSSSMVTHWQEEEDLVAEACLVPELLHHGHSLMLLGWWANGSPPWFLLLLEPRVSSAGEDGSAWPCYPHLLHHCIAVPLGHLQPLCSSVYVEGHLALDLPWVNSLAVFIKSRWEGAICRALAGAFACGMLSMVNLSSPPKGHQPHAGLFPYPRASPGPPGRSHQLWKKLGLLVAWAWMAA